MNCKSIFLTLSLILCKDIFAPPGKHKGTFDTVSLLLDKQQFERAYTEFKHMIHTERYKGPTEAKVLKTIRDDLARMNHPYKTWFAESLLKYCHGDSVATDRKMFKKNYKQMLDEQHKVELIGLPTQSAKNIAKMAHKKMITNLEKNKSYQKALAHLEDNIKLRVKLDQEYGQALKDEVKEAKARTDFAKQHKKLLQQRDHKKLLFPAQRTKMIKNKKVQKEIETMLPYGQMF